MTFLANSYALSSRDQLSGLILRDQLGNAIIYAVRATVYSVAFGLSVAILSGKATTSLQRTCEVVAFGSGLLFLFVLALLMLSHAMPPSLAVCQDYLYVARGDQGRIPLKQIRTVTVTRRRNHLQATIVYLQDNEFRTLGFNVAARSSSLNRARRLVRELRRSAGTEAARG